MEINEKNYSVNKESFLEKNSIGEFKYCPFCGAPISYAVPKEEFTKQSFEKSELDKNTLTILDHAAKLEVFNSDYYLKASKLAKDEKLRDMFRALSNIELTHAKIHMNLAGIQKLPVLRNMDYSRLGSDDILLKTASEREKHAVLYYEKYVDSVNLESVKKVINVLSEIESQHITLTEICLK